MREIKFRGISDHTSIMTGHFVYGNLVSKSCISYTTLNNGYVQIPVDPKTVGQYTGFKDCDGVDIYEGDVLVVPQLYPFYDEAVSNYVGIVEFIFGCWQYVLMCVNPGKAGISDGINNIIDDDGDGGKRFLVIGNIHENPELIKNETA